MFYSRQTVQLRPRICIQKVIFLFWIMYPRVRYPKENDIVLMYTCKMIILLLKRTRTGDPDNSTPFKKSSVFWADVVTR